MAKTTTITPSFESLLKDFKKLGVKFICSSDWYEIFSKDEKSIQGFAFPVERKLLFYYREEFLAWLKLQQ